MGQAPLGCLDLVVFGVVGLVELAEVDTAVARLHTYVVRSANVVLQLDATFSQTIVSFLTIPLAREEHCMLTKTASSRQHYNEVIMVQSIHLCCTSDHYTVFECLTNSCTQVTE